jgi:ribosomal RNA-processing protein 17
MRDQRKVDLERHVAEVNDLLRKANKDSDDEDSAADDGEEWGGIASPPRPSIDGVDEYVDEDKYTTVTIEAMDDAKAFTKDSDDEGETTVTKEYPAAKEGKEVKKKMVWSKGVQVDIKTLPKKKKFRYESKGERKETRNKQKAKNSAAKKARTADK